eukprot:comp22169_c0_seq1/m.32531 comp22169_c0_seq1/g.32531  ORF comp22169_c0_seq1/g.32531 comp22169_c0_seq1/m.32531 type:complete len:330 (-) comp22169_c0_seq1:484-1473(-)
MMEEHESEVPLDTEVKKTVPLANTQSTETPSRPTPASPGKQPSTEREEPQRDVEDSKQPDLVSGFWNVWSSVSQQATKLLQDAEQSQAVGKAVELSKGLATKAVTGLEHVMEAFDPMGGVGAPTEMKVIVTSVQPSKIMAVQGAVATVFPVSDVSVSGVNAPSGVANQPVGFAAGQRGAENRLINTKALGTVDLEGSLVISIENFIAEIEGNWYDMACVILRDDSRDLSHVAFSQGIRVPKKYVDTAMAATAPTYEFQSTGLQMTVGEAIHSERKAIPADDWHGAFTNGHLKRATILENCVVGVMGEYLVELRMRRGSTPKVQPQPATE